MSWKKKFGRKYLSGVQYQTMKKEQENNYDVILEIMDETSFGTHQRKLPEEIVTFFEKSSGYHKNNGHFLPLKNYHSIVKELKEFDYSIKEIPQEVLIYFKNEIDGSSGKKIQNEKGNETNTIVQEPKQIIDPDDITSFTFLPSKLMTKLKEFQLHGVAFGINHNGNCLIADEMGLGKTLQAIAISYYYRREWPLLIICPSSLRQNWKNEITANLSHVNDDGGVVVIFGSNDLSKPLGRVTIMSYEIASKHADFLIGKNYKIVICDECHYLKNPQSKRCRELLPLLLKADHTILMSGTALLSRPCELYPQLQALRFPIFKNFHQFGLRYCKATVTQFGWDYTGNSHLAELHVLLAKYVMIRRLKEDVLKDLPDKERMEVMIDISEEDIQRMKDLRLQMEAQKQKLQNSMKSFYSKSSDSDNDGDSKFEKFAKQAQFMELYTMTCSAKVKGVCSFLDKLILEGKKLLVFGHHQEMLDGIEQHVKENEIEYIRIDGTTNPVFRQKYVNSFQKSQNVKIAILSVTAAGTGITLHSADTVVFAELYWTPGVLRQAEDRVHRIGQKNDVRIFYLLAKQSVDDLIWPLLEKKLKISGEALDGKEIGHDSKKVNVNVIVEDDSLLIANDDFDIEENETKPRRSTLDDYFGKKKSKDNLSTKSKKNLKIKEIEYQNNDNNNVSMNMNSNRFDIYSNYHFTDDDIMEIDDDYTYIPQKSKISNEGFDNCITIDSDSESDCEMKRERMKTNEIDDDFNMIGYNPPSNSTTSDSRKTKSVIDYDDSSELLDENIFETKKKRKTKTIITEITDGKSKRMSKQRKSSNSENLSDKNVNQTSMKKTNIQNVKLKDENGKPIFIGEVENANKMKRKEKGRIDHYFKVTKKLPKSLREFIEKDEMFEIKKKPKIDDDDDDIPSSAFQSMISTLENNTNNNPSSIENNGNILSNVSISNHMNISGNDREDEQKMEEDNSMNTESLLSFIQNELQSTNTSFIQNENIGNEKHYINHKLLDENLSIIKPEKDKKESKEDKQIRQPNFEKFFKINSDKLKKESKVESPTKFDDNDDEIIDIVSDDSDSIELQSFGQLQRNLIENENKQIQMNSNNTINTPNEMKTKPFEIKTNRYIKLTKHQREVLGTSMTETPEEEKKRKTKQPQKQTLDSFLKSKRVSESSTNETKMIKTQQKQSTPIRNQKTKQDEKKENKSVIPIFHPKSMGDDDIEFEPSEFENSMKKLSHPKSKMVLKTLKSNK